MSRADKAVVRQRLDALADMYFEMNALSPRDKPRLKRECWTAIRDLAVREVVKLSRRAAR